MRFREIFFSEGSRPGDPRRSSGGPRPGGPFFGQGVRRRTPWKKFFFKKNQDFHPGFGRGEPSGEAFSPGYPRARVSPGTSRKFHTGQRGEGPAAPSRAVAALTAPHRGANAPGLDPGRGPSVLVLRAQRRPVDAGGKRALPICCFFSTADRTSASQSQALACLLSV